MYTYFAQEFSCRTQHLHFSSYLSVTGEFVSVGKTVFAGPFRFPKWPRTTLAPVSEYKFFRFSAASLPVFILLLPSTVGRASKHYLRDTRRSHVRFSFARAAGGPVYRNVCPRHCCAHRRALDTLFFPSRF